MSKFWIYFKTEAKGTFKETPQILAVFLFLPFFFSVLLGFSFDTAFTPEVTIDPITIHLANQDVGAMGQELAETFETEELAPYFTLETEENADFLVTILPHYSAEMIQTPISITEKPNTSASDREILNSFLIEWQQSIINAEELLAEMANVNNPAVAASLQEDLLTVSSFQVDDIFVAESFESDFALTSNQFSSVTGMMYLLFLTLSSSVSLNTNKEFKGLKKRLGILPLSPTESVLFDLATTTIIYGVLTGLLVIMWKIYDPNTFTGNPAFYLGWVFIYTVFFQALNLALRYIVPEKLSALFYQVFLILYMVFGFLPLDKMVGGSIGELFNQNLIRTIFNQPIYDYMLSGDLFGNSHIAIGLLGTTLFIVSLTIMIRNRRELSYA